MTVQTVKLMRAALALGEFTVRELALYAEVPFKTAQSTLSREQEGEARVAKTGLTRPTRGRPQSVWFVQDAAGIGEYLAGFESIDNARRGDEQVDQEELRADQWRSSRSGRMTKDELIRLVAEESGVPKASAVRVIDHFFSVIQQQVAKGKTASIDGVVSFEPTSRKARKGFNPQTNEPFEVPASKSVKITAGKQFEASLNAKSRH